MDKPHIQVLSPCHESWDAMMPTSAGRHCAACQKVVVDFTQKTDAEILTYLAGASRQPCGRFRAEQLGRPLQPAATANRWRSWLASVLALGGVLGSGRVAAQASSPQSGGGPTPFTTSAAPSATTAATPKSAEAPVAMPRGANEPLVVRGLVTDATTGERLPGVTVVVQGTSQGVSTGANGEFELTLTEHDASGMLVVSFVGYTNQPVAIASFGTTAPLPIKLTAAVMGLGEMIVVGGYNARKPYPWHPRAFVSWGKYWLTRPFRR